MTYTLVYTEEAQSEAKDIFEYYEEQKPGLGEDFYQELDQVFGHIKNHPRIYQRVRNQVRRALLKRFPYGVFYKILDDGVLGEDIVLIAGILHQKSNPEHWPE